MWVFHTLFNTCGKVVDFDWVLHKFSFKTSCFCRHAPSVGLWNGKNERRWKSLAQTWFCLLFSAFSTGVFHQQAFFKLTISSKKTNRPQKRGVRPKKPQQTAFFCTVFPHRKRVFNRGKCTTSIHFGCFPQFPPPLLLLLFIIISFFRYRALRAKESERAPRKEFCYENHIQPPKRKRCSCSFDVCRFR